MKSTVICKRCGKSYETSFLRWQNFDLCKECFNKPVQNAEIASELANQQQAIVDLSKESWKELDSLCDRWSKQEPYALVPRALQLMAWMFVHPPKLFDVIRRMDELLERKHEMRHVVVWANQYQGSEDIANNPLFYTFVSLIESIRTDSYTPLDEAITKFSQSAELLVIRGLVAVGQDKSRFFEKALSINPRLPITLLLLASEYSATGRKRDSVALILRLIEVCPDSAEGHFILGKECLESGQPAPAAYHFRKVITLQPESELSNTARNELETRLKSVNVLEIPNYDSAASPIALNVIPERVRPSPRTRRTMSQAQIIFISVTSVFVVGGPIAGALGTHDAKVGVAVGVVVYLLLSKLYGRRS